MRLPLALIGISLLAISISACETETPQGSYTVTGPTATGYQVGGPTYNSGTSTSHHSQVSRAGQGSQQGNYTQGTYSGGDSNQSPVYPSPEAQGSTSSGSGYQVGGDAGSGYQVQ